MCDNAVYDSFLDRYICKVSEEECFFSDPDINICSQQYGEIICKL